ncbi:hypothetical protein [Paenibacillus oleatilyticus]|uniref:hypothetical protein n=1 Tax=Paenibacillus oleatilyticus TaxID=2594886 RepID=UPI001C1FDD24|nr:hypothetical protein [Paenibacillus oleatilyticus]MBU7316029.1 hypothetical protein [Paenibacillus oleatilyticus]
MGKYGEEIVARLKESASLPKEEKSYQYCLTHTHDHEPRRYYIEAPYTPDIFEAICAYIQFECAEIEDTYSMDQTDVIEILEKFYECKSVKRTKANQVDLYLNWEYFCGSQLQIVECLKRDGMNEYFQKYIDEYLLKIKNGEIK